jgi:hypothetical protein
MSTARESLHQAVMAASKAIEQDGGVRSALRRAERGLDVIGIEAVDRFVRQAGQQYRWLGEALEDAVILIAHRQVLPFSKTGAVRLEARGELARRFGEVRSTCAAGRQTVLSALRLQRLIRASGSEDRLRQMRRALFVLDAPIHPVHAVEGFLDLHSDDGRRQFARAFFAGVTTIDSLDAA